MRRLNSFPHIYHHRREHGKDDEEVSDIGAEKTIADEKPVIESTKLVFTNAVIADDDALLDLLD